MKTSHEILEEMSDFDKSNSQRVTFIDQIKMGSNNVKLTVDQVGFLRGVIVTQLSLDKADIVDALPIATWINSCT